MKPSNVWCFGLFELRPVERRLLKRGVDLPLQPKSFDVLLILVENANKLVSRQELMETVWAGTHVQDANLTNCIAMLRRKLGKDSIRTVSKSGYCFHLTVTRLSGVSQTASDRLQDGQAQMHERTTRCVTNAKHLFWLAIAEEPGFAEAWAWLARASRYLEKGGVDPDLNRQMAHAAFLRAFALDPDLPSAHQFYTNFQIDCGKPLDAMKRLLDRVWKYPADAHSYAGLVQICRFCGLLDVSIAAYKRVLELDSTIETSIPHTHFARCDYSAVVETYAVIGKASVRGYLDAAAWTCLGAEERVTAEISDRLAAHVWPPRMEALLESLLCAIRGDSARVDAICDAQDLREDPESALYFARHLARCGCSGRAIAMLRQSIGGGLSVPTMLQQDPWLASLRKERAFVGVLREAIKRQDSAEQVFRDMGGPQLLSPIAQSPKPSSLRAASARKTKKATRDGRRI